MVDFLIIKRAIKLDGTGQATLSQRDQTYVQAVDDLMKCYPLDDTERARRVSSPLINVFGTADHADSGYRTAKYYSNGTNSTISNKPWEPIVEIHSEDPRIVALRPGYEQHLRDLLLKAKGELPRLIDSAIWFFRAMDISETLGEAGSTDAGFSRLTKAYTAELGLIKKEIAMLFDTTLSPG